MYLATIYVLQWSGIWSNLFVVGACLLLGFCLFCMVIVIIAAINDVRRARATRKGSIGKSILRALPSILFLGFLAALIGIGSRETSSGALRAGAEGAEQGYVAGKKMSGGFLVLISIVGIPVFVVFLVQNLFFESPLALSVTPTRIEAVYRLPWRHMSIDLAHVTDVALVHRVFRRNGGFKYDSYQMKITHDGVVTDVSCDVSVWYQDQLKAAYQTIESNKPKQHG